MSPIKRLARNFLSGWGYELRRITTPTITFAECLTSQLRSQQDKSPETIEVFDDDLKVQFAVRTYFPFTKATFYRCTEDGTRRVRYEPPLGIARGAWVILAIERYPVGDFFSNEASVSNAEAIFIRCSLGSFESGRFDLATIVSQCEQYGLLLSDVATVAQPVALNTSNTSITLAFVRSFAPSNNAEKDKNRLKRLDEARAFLTRPVGEQKKFRWLAGRGSFGFDAGVFNPGTIIHDKRLILLSRAEEYSWADQSQSEVKYVSSCRPLLCESDDSLTVSRSTKLPFISSLLLNTYRIEDFRLFEFRGELFCNHSVISLADNHAAQERPLLLNSLRIRLGFSAINVSDTEMRFMGFPSIDFDVAKTEKNWAMLARGDELFLIYSIIPYRVLKALNWRSLEFKTELNIRLQLPFAADLRPIRNSINPVEYDARSFLHIVHKVYPQKQYVFWALLLDKNTLRPTHAGRRPIVRAGLSISAALIYASSAVVYKDRVFVFGGINDCSSGYWVIERSELDINWEALP